MDTKKQQDGPEHESLGHAHPLAENLTRIIERGISYLESLEPHERAELADQAKASSLDTQREY